MTRINLPTLVTDLPVCLTSITKAPFFFHPHLQIPQSNLCTISAACLLKDSSRVTLDYVLGCLDPCRDLRIRVLGKQAL